LIAKERLLHQLPPPPPGKTGWPWTEETDPGLFSPDTEWPKISIVTPSYNQGEFIEKTIRSILLQDYPNLEYFIVDGGSSDNSVETIYKYSKWISQWGSEPDKGQSDALNKGFTFASGDFLGWINSDDFLLPGALFKLADSIKSNPDISIWVGEADKRTAKGELIYTCKVPELSLESFLHWRNPQRPRNKGYFLQPACFFSKKAWEECGPLRQDLDYCMDVALWLEMVQKFKFGRIEEKMAVAIGHPTAKTTQDIEKTTIEISLLISSYGGFDIVKPQMMQLANELSILKAKQKRIQNHPFLRHFTPLVRLFSKLWN
jgi:cellulose synthase/poly-beta-1,6-N-acetylglucosamine synthase-like glycosyltransferase